MAAKVAINGFGRIGRLALRIALENPHFEIVAINDVSDPKVLMNLLKYDSVHGRFNQRIEEQEGGFLLNGRFIRMLTEKDPAKLPWAELGVDIVLECTGRFRTRETAGQH